jgi:hypothetical protein
MQWEINGKYCYKEQIKIHCKLKKMVSKLEEILIY